MPVFFNVKMEARVARVGAIIVRNPIFQYNGIISSAHYTHPHHHCPLLIIPTNPILNQAYLILPPPLLPSGPKPAPYYSPSYHHLYHYATRKKRLQRRYSTTLMTTVRTMTRISTNMIINTHASKYSYSYQTVYTKVFVLL